MKLREIIYAALSKLTKLTKKTNVLPDAQEPSSINEILTEEQQMLYKVLVPRVEVETGAAFTINRMKKIEHKDIEKVIDSSLKDRVFRAANNLYNDKYCQGYYGENNSEGDEQPFVVRVRKKSNGNNPPEIEYVIYSRDEEETIWIKRKQN